MRVVIKLGMAIKKTTRKTGYQSDVSDEEWAFCAPYLTLMKEDAPQRDYSSRELFNAVRYMVRAGCPWRMIPPRSAALVDRACAGAALDQGGVLGGDGA